jgi:hypothetical protein
VTIWSGFESSRTAAVSLFVERAQGIAPGFSMFDGNKPPQPPKLVSASTGFYWPSNWPPRGRRR